MGELWDHSDLVFNLISEPLSWKTRIWLSLRFFRRFLSIKPNLALLVDGSLPESSSPLTGVELLKYVQNPGITWTESLDGERLWVFAPGLRPFARLGVDVLAETQKFYPHLKTYHIPASKLLLKPKNLGGSPAILVRRGLLYFSYLFLSLGLLLFCVPLPDKEAPSPISLADLVLLETADLQPPPIFKRPPCFEELDLDSIHLTPDQWEMSGTPVSLESILACLNQHPSVEVLEAPLGYGLKSGERFVLKGKNVKP